MKYLSNKKGFLGTDNKSNVKEKVVVIPFGLEKTVSYGGGTSKGPKEIIRASHQVELFDEDLNKEPYKYIGIKTLEPFPIKKNMIDALKQIENINKILLDKKKFPLTLGGEHSLTPGAIRPFIKKFGKICLLHFDAHADLRNSYNNNKFSHASAIRRCLDNPNVNVVSFGVRNISLSEISFLRKNKKRIKIFWAKDKSSWNLSQFKKIVKIYKLLWPSTTIIVGGIHASNTYKLILQTTDTDYVFRGESEVNDGEIPAVQASLTWTHNNGTYVGVFGSTNKFESTPDIYAVIGPYFGKSGEVFDSKFSYNVFIFHYMYPGADGLDYTETRSSLINGIGLVRIKIQVDCLVH